MAVIDWLPPFSSLEVDGDLVPIDGRKAEINLEHGFLEAQVREGKLFYEYVPGGGREDFSFEIIIVDNDMRETRGHFLVSFTDSGFAIVPDLVFAKPEGVLAGSVDGPVVWNHPQPKYGTFVPEESGAWSYTPFPFVKNGGEEVFSWQDAERAGKVVIRVFPDADSVCAAFGEEETRVPARPAPQYAEAFLPFRGRGLFVVDEEACNLEKFKALPMPDGVLTVEGKADRILLRYDFEEGTAHKIPFTLNDEASGTITLPELRIDYEANGRFGLASAIPGAVFDTNTESAFHVGENGTWAYETADIGPDLGHFPFMKGDSGNTLVITGIGNGLDYRLGEAGVADVTTLVLRGKAPLHGCKFLPFPVAEIRIDGQYFFKEGDRELSQAFNFASGSLVVRFAPAIGMLFYTFLPENGVETVPVFVRFLDGQSEDFEIRIVEASGQKGETPEIPVHEAGAEMPEISGEEEAGPGNEEASGQEADPIPEFSGHEEGVVPAGGEEATPGNEMPEIPIQEGGIPDDDFEPLGPSAVGVEMESDREIQAGEEPPLTSPEPGETPLEVAEPPLETSPQVSPKPPLETAPSEISEEPSGVEVSPTFSLILKKLDAIEGSLQRIEKRLDAVEERFVHADAARFFPLLAKFFAELGDK